MIDHPHAATDSRLLETLKHVHNCGASLYNAGAHAEAFRMYQGGLFVARGLLDHRPEVRRVIEDGLAEVAAVDATARLRAFRLHEVIEQVRADLKAIWKTVALEKALEAAEVEADPPAGRPVS
jgi:hypothetical protein